VFVGGIDRGDEVISREAERPLRLFVAHDPNIGGFPLTTPGIDMGLCDGREAACAGRVMERGDAAGLSARPLHRMGLAAAAFDRGRRRVLRDQVRLQD
jgi:hypothetical protein